MSRFYAFALNEYRYRRVGFTGHETQVAAERAAYRASGQASRAGKRVGDLSAEGDLTPTVIAGREGLIDWARDCNYRIDWEEKVLIYIEGGDTVPTMAKKSEQKKTKKPLDSYLKRDHEIVKKSIRAPEDLWGRIERLAEEKGESVNLIVVAMMEKGCDEEGV